MKLAVLMDELHLIKPYKDSTIRMLQRAIAMGWSCCFFTPHDLVCREGQAFASMSSLDIGNDLHATNWATVKSLGELPLSQFDIILMRKDPPFDMQYIYHTYAIELAERQGVLVANKPQSLRDANEKFFTLQFPQCCPPTLVTQRMDELKQFWRQHQDVIFKPLQGMGGESIFRVDASGANLSVILEALTQREKVTIMAQQYIPAIVHEGDKRILLINGEPVPYALARIPKPGELRGNLAAGAEGKVVPITEKDRWLCNEIAPTLRDKGLYFVGVDVIGDYITEINVTSPTCIREIEAAQDVDIAGDYLRCLEAIHQAKRCARQ